jgi:DNA-directed RNA polymerase subunit RPC12/RpoP
VAAMAAWALTCKRCGQLFSDTQISEALFDYYFPAKPKFPPEGRECECPHCKAKFIYQQREFTYQS